VASALIVTIAARPTQPRRRSLFRLEVLPGGNSSLGLSVFILWQGIQ
jgi:hypothetical protein